MPSPRNPGRFAGLIYALISVPGAFALVYVPSKIIVHGDATATAANLAAHESFFRFGIATQFVFETLFIWVALLLYDLLKAINRRHAALMLGLIIIPLPIVLFNELNSIAAVTLVHGAPFLSAFDKPQRESLAMLFLTLHSHGLHIASIFWGLWLLPLGLLVYRSGFFPRILGILLIAHCVYYVVTALTTFAMPQYELAVDRWLTPLKFGELIFMFWLLIMGAIPKPAMATASD